MSVVRKVESVIKIELTEENAYQNCLIETQEGGIVHVICDDPQKKNDLITLIGGRQISGGICVLNGVDTKAHLEEYKKKVDVIDIEKIESTLKVKDYIVFYAMVTDIYSEDFAEKLKTVLIENDMEYVWNTKVNELSNIEKIKVRCIAAYLKQVRCLVGKNLLNGLDQIQRETFYAFLKEYFIKSHCLCLLFDNIQKNEEYDRILIV